MEEFKYESNTYTDSLRLYEHLISFKNAEDEFGDGEFAIKIKYNNTKDLIELIDHLKDFYGNYYGNGGFELVMTHIWDEVSPTDEQENILDESYNYWKSKIDN